MKKHLKKLINGLATLIALPLIILDKVAHILLKSDSIFISNTQFLSLIPGKLGNYIRKSYFHWTMTHCATDCFIGFGTLFSQRDTEIHDNVYIGSQCNIGKCRIEQSCLLGSGVHVLSGKQQHNFMDLETPIQEQGGRYEKIVIGEDTWIGNNAVVMANIGKKCIIGAGSVVTKAVPDFSIVGGNPARVLKSRLDD